MSRAGPEPDAFAIGPRRPALSRRRFLRSALLVTGGSVVAPMLNFGRVRLLASESSSAAGTDGPIEVSIRAVDIVLSSVVIDMLGLLTQDWRELARWQNQVGEFGEPEFRQLERSGVRILHPAVETGSRDPHQAALRWVAGWNALTAGDSCFLGRVVSTGDLDLMAGQGRIGVVIGFQNSDHFLSKRDVELFFGLGQRVSQLTYNERNLLGSGCHASWDRGLTRFGAEIVAEMNRVGMAIDLSHCGERTSLDAIAASRHPVLMTHANCRALVPGQRRCRSDELIRATAKSGGVMGITVIRPFVGPGAATLDDLLDHFDHVRRLVGVEHVGLGSDLDVAPDSTRSAEARALYGVRGLDPVARVFQIADGLLARGYERSELELVLGGNFRRALEAIWPGLSVPAESDRRRDPFCPAPDRRTPSELAVRAG